MWWNFLSQWHRDIAQGISHTLHKITLGKFNSFKEHLYILYYCFLIQETTNNEAVGDKKGNAVKNSFNRVCPLMFPGTSGL